jgi:hypothetical protein
MRDKSGDAGFEFFCPVSDMITMPDTRLLFAYD